MRGGSSGGAPGLGRRLVELAVVFVAYGAAARFGLRFGPLGGLATAVWPPSGIALGALLLRGRHLWPGIFLAAAVVNAAAGAPIWAAALIGVGNTLEPVLAATLLRRFGLDHRLARLRDVFLLVTCAALLSTAVSATFGLGAALLSGVRAADSYPVFWAVWWIGDAMGVLLVGALVCTWWGGPLRLSRRALRWVEGALLFVALLAVSVVVFRRLFPNRAVELVRGTYAIVPFFIWAALRFEQRGTTVALVLVAAVALTSAVEPGRFFEAATVHERLLMVQCYMAVTAVSMLTLAAAISERRLAIGVRDEFISIASHELKTPLTALRLRLAAANRAGAERTGGGEVDEKLVRNLVAASSSLDRLMGLVDDLLDVSRLTAGRMVLHVEPTRLDELVREVAVRMGEQAGEAGSGITLQSLEPVTVALDRNRIEQVVTNLVSNAIKYGMGKRIEVSVRSTGAGAEVKVRDQGIGISKSDQARIFQAFERVVTSSRVGGLGLGLYIGRQIAAAHGGTLTVDSALGRGTTFTLELPARSEKGGTSGPTPGT